MELVFNNNGNIVTNSLLVAEKFGKDHKHVLSAIDEIIEGLDENSATLFESSYYTHPQNKQSFRMYIMGEDGFSLLVMGFTGKKAMKFKLEYVSAFKQMREIIKKQNVKPLSQLDVLVQQTNALIEQSSRIDAIEDKLTYLEAKTTTSPDYFAVAGYAALNGFACSLPVAGSLGRMATKKCKEEGISMGKIHDPRFGNVNTYPMGVLESVFKQYFSQNL